MLWSLEIPFKTGFTVQSDAPWVVQNNLFVNKQDRQRAYNKTWRGVRATTAEVGKQYVLYVMSVCL